MDDQQREEQIRQRTYDEPLTDAETRAIRKAISLWAQDRSWDISPAGTETLDILRAALTATEEEQKEDA